MNFRSEAFRLGLVVAVLTLLTFGLGSLFGFEEWTGNLMRNRLAPPVFALLVIAVLAADIVMPVPASIVIVAGGSALGFVPGMLAALTGLVLSSLIGYRIGVRLAPRDAQPKEKGWWPLVAIALLRCVPVAAETSAVVAGRERVPLSSFAMAVSIGSLPFAAGLAFAGAKLAGMA